MFWSRGCCNSTKKGWVGGKIKEEIKGRKEGGMINRKIHRVATAFDKTAL